MVFLKDKVVTDGQIVFDDYVWYVENKKLGLWSKYWKKKILFYINKNIEEVVIYKDGAPHTKSLNVLIKRSFPQKYLPKDLDTYIDIYGYQDKYSFNPNNPNEVWSKRFLKYIKLSTNKNKHAQHLLFNVVRDKKIKTHYIHRMVWESYNKQIIPKGYVIHHLSHQSFDNKIQNLVLLPRGVHSQFEKWYQIYAHKSDFYVNELPKEEFIDRINKFDIEQEIKQKLINSL